MVCSFSLSVLSGVEVSTADAGWSVGPVIKLLTIKLQVKSLKGYWPFSACPGRRQDYENSSCPVTRRRTIRVSRASQFPVAPVTIVF